jgi:hypothetical protein
MQHLGQRADARATAPDDLEPDQLVVVELLRVLGRGERIYLRD